MIKKLIQKILFLNGYELKFHPLSPKLNSSYQLLKGLEEFNIDIVFDIGANSGQFAEGLRAIGYKGLIISFEPLSSAHKQLTKNSLKDPLWIVHEQTAIGDFEGKIEINISANSQSSSVLKILDAHTSVQPQSMYIDKEEVKITSLDTIYSQYINAGKKYFVKIDTQGFEWNVLNGAENFLDGAKGVLCEMSLAPLYEDQHLWLDIINRLESAGFTLWAIQPGFTNPLNGKALQLDGLFFRC